METFYAFELISEREINWPWMYRAANKQAQIRNVLFYGDQIEINTPLKSLGVHVSVK